MVRNLRGLFALTSLAFGLWAVGACGSTSKPTADGAQQSGSFEGDPAGPGAGEADGGGTGEAGDEGPVVDDTGSSGGDDAAGIQGCEKVDFLFVIDNSVSMREEQAALIASFPKFMDTIQSTLSATSDYHVMVVDTDAETRCTESNCRTKELEAGPRCVKPDGGYACNTEFEPCDATLGAGVVHPAGDGASNALCELHGGNRYMVEGDPTLSSSFACVAQVGLAGHPSERPMDAIVAAVASDINAPGGCNAGFLRDDAILVITFISDDPHREDAGTPADWYDAVVKAKGGNADAIAVLGLTPAFDECDSKDGAGEHWSEFVKLWQTGRSIEAPVCSDDYSGVFAEAVAIIDDTCDDFVPR